MGREGLAGFVFRVYRIKPQEPEGSVGIRRNRTNRIETYEIEKGGQIWTERKREGEQKS